MTEPTLEQIQEFFDVLTTGEPPEDWRLSNLLKLTPRQAFTVVYLMQEQLGIVPDHYELCSVCDELFDTHYGEQYLDDDTEIDEWYECLGVTKEMLEPHKGNRFCSSECEAAFWIKVKNER